MLAKGKRVRTRVALSQTERQAIRDVHRQYPEWTQEKLATWATQAFARPIRQTVISDALRSRYEYGEILGFEATSAAEQAYATLQDPSPDEMKPALSPKHSGRASVTSEMMIRESSIAKDDCRTVLFSVSAQFHVEMDRNRTPIADMGDDQQTPTILRKVSTSDLYLSQFFARLVDNALHLSGPVDSNTHWFITIHDRLASSSSGPLRAALRAVLIRHAGMVTGDSQIALISKHFYGQALRDIQQAVNSGNLNLDLVSAIMLSGCYEVLEHAEGEHDYFQDHVQGAHQIIQMLGPHQFNDSYGRAILPAFSVQLMFTFHRGTLTDFALDWVSLPASILGDDLALSLGTFLKELHTNTTESATLRRTFYELGLPSLDQRVNAAFLERLLLFRLKMYDWRRRFQEAVPALHEPSLSTSGASRIPYVPRNARAASMWCGGLTVLVGVNDYIRKFYDTSVLTEDEIIILDELQQAADLVPISGLHLKKAISIFNTPDTQGMLLA